METPPTLEVTLTGDRLRGQLRPAVDPVHLRRLWLSTLGSVVLLFLGERLHDPAAMTAAFLLGFVVLLSTVSSVFAVIALPQTFELDDRAFSVGDDTWPLGAIARAEATDGPRKLLILFADGTRKVFLIQEERHDLIDIAWLADEVNRRLRGRS